MVSGYRHQNQTGRTTIDLCQFSGSLSSEPGAIGGTFFALHKQSLSIRNIFAEKVIRIAEL
jgi:hypothetical protein